jgi:anaerobic ribonucleoside-triphosphate reductase activating protein
LYGIDGITLLGGEPTDQLDALTETLEDIRRLGWSVILFTGKEIEDFRSEQEVTFIEMCDLIVCGPFKKDQLNLFLHFRGSSNQRIVKMNDRFRNLEIKDGRNVVSLKIQSDSSMVNLGFPDDELTQLIMEHAVCKDDGYDGS